MFKILNVASHPIDLDSGRTLAPGEEAEADLDHPHNKSLVDDGLAVEVAVDTKPQSKAANTTTGEDNKS